MGKPTRKTMNKAIIAKFPPIRPKTEDAKARLGALKAYIDFKPMKDVWAFGVTTTEVLRMYRRAHELHEDGRVWGYRVCELHVYVIRRTKKNGKGRFGEFQAFLNGPHPALAKLRRAIDLARQKNTNAAEFHREIFMPVCETLMKLADDVYPMNTGDKCYKTLRALINKPLSSEVQVVETDEEALALYSDLMRRLMRHAKPLQICQFDECKIDLAGFVSVRDADGELKFVAFRDATLLLLVDGSHPIIWAYIIFFHPVVSTEDMLLFVAETDIAWQARKIQPGNKNYSLGTGLPTGVFPELAGAQPTTLMGDRALAHKALLFAMEERSKRGYHLHLGPPHQWWVRCNIEGTFSVVDRTALHNDRNTTGTGPDDPRRERAFEAAGEMGFTEISLKDRISVALVDYVATRHGGRKSGLEHLRELLAHDKNYMIRTLPPAVDGAIPIGSISRWMTVKDSSTGKYVEHYAVWRGTAFDDLPAGTKVEVVISVRDVRTPTVYVDGCSRGKLTIEARWRTGGPLTYAALVAAARSKRSGKNKDYPKRSEEDIDTALAQLERNVAGTPASKCKSPQPGAALVADLRGDGGPQPPSASSAGPAPVTPPSGESSRDPASTDLSESEPAAAAPFVNAPVPVLPEEIQKLIKAKKLIYLGGD